MTGQHRVPQHACAAAAALVVLPFAHKGLAVAADGRLPTAGGYALAWSAFAVALALHHRRPGLLWLAVAWLTLLTAVTDVSVVRSTITELTGATW